MIWGPLNLILAGVNAGIFLVGGHPLMNLAIAGLNCAVGVLWVEWHA